MHSLDNPVLALFAFALAGLSLGFGLVVGAFVARSLRRYMESEDMKPYAPDRRDRRDDDTPPEP